MKKKSTFSKQKSNENNTPKTQKIGQKTTTTKKTRRAELAYLVRLFVNHLIL